MTHYIGWIGCRRFDTWARTLARARANIRYQALKAGVYVRSVSEIEMSAAS